MNPEKQYQKLQQLMLNAEECTDREKAKKIIKKSNKIQKKLTKG